MNFAPINSFLSNIVALVAITVVAYVSSLFIWQILDQQIGVATITNPITTQNDDATDKGLLFSSYPMFGTAPIVKKVKKRVVKKAKVAAVAPKVSLRLRGILAGKESYAIVEVGRDQNVYAKGESISYLYIEKIADDYMILSDDGIEHKIYVSDKIIKIGGGEPSAFTEQPSSQGASSAGAKVSQGKKSVDNNALPTYTADLSFKEKQRFQEFKKSIRKNPLQMIGKLNAQPHRQNGQLIGYQITPGSERALFSKVGLKSGDIVLSVNGKSLDKVGSFTEGMRFMEELSGANELDLLINRRGIEQRIFVTIN